MEYLDFEVEIGKRIEARSSTRRHIYPVAVLHSPEGVGEPRSEMAFTLTGDRRELKLARLQTAILRSGSTTTTRRIATPEAGPVQDLGQTLYESLFAGETGACFEMAQRAAQSENKGLRVKLRIEAPELAVLPWEFIYDPRGAGNFIGLSTETPLVRYVEVPRLISSLRVELPLRILGAVASPSDLEPLDVALEQYRLEKALAALIDQGKVELTWLKGQTWQDLRQAMWQGPWHVLHFIGHGDFNTQLDEGVIALADESGRSHLLTATQASRLLAGQSALRLVVLNSCDGARGSNRDLFSSTAVTLVSSGIPAVVAMQYEISDEAAVEFGSSFYRAIAHGIPVDAAVAEARIAITMRTNDTAEWGIPVLYMRSPDGRLFDLESPATAAPPQARDGTELATTAADPGIPGATAKLEEARLADLYAQARTAAEQRDWAGAIDRLSAILAVDPGYLDASVRLHNAQGQLELSQLYAEAGRLSHGSDWEGVLSVLERARAIDPTFPDPDNLESRARDRLVARQPAEPVPETPVAKPPSKAAVFPSKLAVLVAVLVCGVAAIWLTGQPAVIRSWFIHEPPAATSPDTHPELRIPETKGPTVIDPGPLESPPAVPTAEPALAATVIPQPTLTFEPTSTPRATPRPTSTSLPTPTPTVDQLWIVQLAQLDLVWDRDWQRTIQMLTEFASAHPDFLPAEEKLYAARVAYAGELYTSGETDAAIGQLEAAGMLLPDRPEAKGTLVALTPTPTDVPNPSPAPVNPAPARPAPNPGAPPTAPAPPEKPPARPLVPGGPTTG